MFGTGNMKWIAFVFCSLVASQSSLASIRYTMTEISNILVNRRPQVYNATLKNLFGITYNKIDGGAVFSTTNCNGFCNGKPYGKLIIERDSSGRITGDLFTKFVLQS